MPWWAIASMNLQGAHWAGRGDPSSPVLVSVAARPARYIDTGDMANRAGMSITVTASRGASRITFSTQGRYISLPVNGISEQLARQPIQPTTSPLAFWQSVLAVVTAALPEAAG